MICSGGVVSTPPISPGVVVGSSSGSVTLDSSGAGVAVSSGNTSGVVVLLSTHFEIISTKEITTCLLTAADFAALCEENKKMTAILQTIRTPSKMRRMSIRFFFFCIVYLSFIIASSFLFYHIICFWKKQVFLQESQEKIILSTQQKQRKPQKDIRILSRT